MRKILVIVAIAFALSGCVSTPTEQKKVIAELAVKYAVLKVADNNPEKAARVAAIVREVRAVAGTNEANTVDLLLAYVRIRIDKLTLAPEDRMLVNTLVEMIAQELKSRLGDGVLDPDKLLIVNEVAGWIVDAAALVPAK